MTLAGMGVMVDRSEGFVFCKEEINKLDICRNMRNKEFVTSKN